MILEGVLLDGSALEHADARSLTDSDADDELRLEMALRRRLERMREPQLFHPIEPSVPTRYPAVEKAESLPEADVARRAERRRSLTKELRKRIAKHIPSKKLEPLVGPPGPPDGMSRRSSKPPSHFSGRPVVEKENQPAGKQAQRAIDSGDSLAAKARRMKRRRKDP